MECQPHSYQDETGGARCKSDCLAGSYISPDKSQCSQCESGRITNVRNKHSCIVCPAGRLANEAKSSCDACPRGYYNDLAGAAACKSCGKGHVVAANSTSCERCPLGRYSDEIATSAPTTRESVPVCKANCGAGHYILANQTACVKCEYGKYSDESNVAECRDDCAAGHYVTADQNACVQCKAGMYADIPGLSSCRLCEVGMTSEIGASLCDPLKDPSDPNDSPDSSSASSGSASSSKDDTQSGADSDPRADSDRTSTNNGIVVPTRNDSTDGDGDGVLLPVMIILVVALVLTVIALLIRRRTSQSGQAPVLFSSTMRRDSNVSVGLALDAVDNFDGDVEPGRLKGMMPVAQTALPYGAVVASTASSSVSKPPSGKSMQNDVAVAVAEGKSSSVSFRATEVLNPAHGALGLESDHGDRPGIQPKNKSGKKSSPSSHANGSQQSGRRLVGSSIRATRRAALMKSMPEK